MNATLAVQNTADDINGEAQGESSRTLLCEFVSSDDPANPKFDKLQAAIKERLRQHPEGKALLNEIEAKVQALNQEP
jgi:hypothetical protein